MLCASVRAQDSQSVDFEDYVYNHAHITFFRLVCSDEETNQVLQQLQHTAVVNSKGQLSAANSLLYDGVQLLGAALLDLRDAVHQQLLTRPDLDCDQPPKQVWPHGTTLFNYLNAANLTRWNISSLSGRLLFTKAVRSSLKVHVLELGPAGPTEAGHWASEHGFVLSHAPRPTNEPEEPAVPMLRIVTLPDPPFVFEQFDEKDRPLTGRKRFTGYCIDLLDIIADNLGFNYSIEIVTDRLTGVEDAAGNWNGMVRELIDDHADLAVGSLTITHKREAVIDFTEPFMQVCLTLKNPSRKP